MRLLLLTITVLCVAACTLDVGKPNISIECVEVTFPGESVTYCDAGASPPSDAKSDKDGG